METGVTDAEGVEDPDGEKEGVKVNDAVWENDANIGTSFRTRFP